METSHLDFTPYSFLFYLSVTGWTGAREWHDTTVVTALTVGEINKKNCQQLSHRRRRCRCVSLNSWWTNREKDYGAGNQKLFSHYVNKCWSFARESSHSSTNAESFSFCLLRIIIIVQYNLSQNVNSRRNNVAARRRRRHSPAFHRWQISHNPSK